MRFNRYIGISLLIHAAVLLPFVFHAFSTPQPKARELKLDLELFDMLSDREVEEKQMAGVPELPPAPKPKPKPEETPVKPQDEPIPVTAAVELPAEFMEEPTEQAIESPVVIPVAVPVAVASADVSGGSGVFLPASGIGTGGGGSGGNDAINRRGETLRRGRAGDADPLSLYTARVARRLQSNLIYPEKMRRKGIEAVTTIIFTVTAEGQIKKDSLKVRKSSGYGEMDDNALKAARESAPFDEPPKEMTLVIDVAFEVGRSRR